MAIRTYKPTSPARRFMSVLTYEEITKKSPEKSLVEYLKKNAGRNKQSQPTSVRRMLPSEKRRHRLNSVRTSAICVCSRSLKALYAMPFMENTSWKSPSPLR